MCANTCSNAFASWSNSSRFLGLFPLTVREGGGAHVKNSVFSSSPSPSGLISTRIFYPFSPFFWHIIPNSLQAGFLFFHESPWISRTAKQELWSLSSYCNCQAIYVQFFSPFPLFSEFQFLTRLLWVCFAGPGTTRGIWCRCLPHPAGEMCPQLGLIRDSYKGGERGDLVLRRWNLIIVCPCTTSVE